VSYEYVLHDVSNGRWEFRIHPDDEHLQYGPVATAFRDMALYTDNAELPEIVELFMDMAGSNWVIEIEGCGSFYTVDNDEYNLLVDFTRLFFAEYLADEGL
jgi:hypothetical protein